MSFRGPVERAQLREPCRGKCNFQSEYSVWKVALLKRLVKVGMCFCPFEAAFGINTPESCGRSMYFKPRLRRARKRPIIWMASHHSLMLSTSSSFCISKNDFLPSQPTIQMQKYQSILGLSLKIEVRDKNSESAERTRIRSGRMFTFSLRASQERKTKHFIIVYKSVLSVFTQEFSLVVWLRFVCDRKMSP